MQHTGSSLANLYFLTFDLPDDRGKHTPLPLSKTPELAKGDPIPTEATSSDTNTKPPAPHLLEPVDTPLNTISTLPPSDPVADVMDAPPPAREPTPTPKQAPEVPAYPAPLPDPVPTSTAHEKTHEKEEVEKEEETNVEETASSSDTLVAPPSTSNGVGEVELERLSVTLPSTHLDAPLESPIAQPEELRLPNGLPLPAPQDPEVPAISTAERDDSPIAEPDVSEQTSTEITQATSAPVVHATLAPVEEPAPVPTVQEIAIEPVVPAASAVPEVQDTAPSAALDVKEDTPVPQSTAKEDTPSPAEMVSIAESTPEIVATPPPPTAEEREDTPPPPQTVAPAPVETTMQGQSLTITSVIVTIFHHLQRKTVIRIDLRLKH